jgi:hypothetical protein
MPFKLTVTGTAGLFKEFVFTREWQSSLKPSKRFKESWKEVSYAIFPITTSSISAEAKLDFKLGRYVFIYNN